MPLSLGEITQRFGKHISKVVSTHRNETNPEQPLPTGDFSRDSGFLIGVAGGVAERVCDIGGVLEFIDSLISMNLNLKMCVQGGPLLPLLLINGVKNPYK